MHGLGVDPAWALHQGDTRAWGDDSVDGKQAAGRAGPAKEGKRCRPERVMEW